MAMESGSLVIYSTTLQITRIHNSTAHHTTPDEGWLLNYWCLMGCQGLGSRWGVRGWGAGGVSGGSWWLPCGPCGPCMSDIVCKPSFLLPPHYRQLSITTYYLLLKVFYDLNCLTKFALKTKKLPEFLPRHL